MQRRTLGTTEKSERFPGLFIVYAGVNLALGLFDAFVPPIILPNVPAFEIETVRGLVKTLAFVLVWVTYMRKSERVRNTFIVKPRAAEPWEQMLGR